MKRVIRLPKSTMAFYRALKLRKAEIAWGFPRYGLSERDEEKDQIENYLAVCNQIAWIRDVQDLNARRVRGRFSR